MSDIEHTPGQPMVVEGDSTQPNPSVTDTVILPEQSPVAVDVLCPSLHRYVNGAVPPKTFAVAPPLQFPHTVSSVLVIARKKGHCEMAPGKYETMNHKDRVIIFLIMIVLDGWMVKGFCIVRKT